MDKMRVNLNHNVGGGFSGLIEVSRGTTVGALMRAQVGGSFNDYSVGVRRMKLENGFRQITRLDGSLINENTELQDRDQITFSARDMKGA